LAHRFLGGANFFTIITTLCQEFMHILTTKAGVAHEADRLSS